MPQDVDMFKYLEETPNSRDIDPAVFAELLKLYKAIRRLGLDVQELQELQESQPLPNPGEYQVVVNGIGVDVLGDEVYATPL